MCSDQLEAENSDGKTVLEIAKTQFNSGKTPSSEIVDMLSDTWKSVGGKRPTLLNAKVKAEGQGPTEEATS